MLVHELAHLVVADHSAAFHALVDRYPKAERARGFLMAKSFGADGDDVLDADAADADIDTDGSEDDEPTPEAAVALDGAPPRGRHAGRPAAPDGDRRR